MYKHTFTTLPENVNEFHVLVIVHCSSLWLLSAHESSLGCLRIRLSSLTSHATWPARTELILTCVLVPGLESHTASLSFAPF